MFDPRNCQIGDVIGFVAVRKVEPVTESVRPQPERWLIGIAEPPHEWDTCRRLREELGVELYIPIVQKQRRAGRNRLVDIIEPLIRPYFFVPASIDERQYRAIRATRGVHDFLQINDKPAVIRDGELERARREEKRREELRLRRILSSGKGPRYIVGEPVTVTVGYLRLEAKVHAIPSSNRVAVKLEEMTLFGRDVVEVDLAHLAPSN